MLSTLGLQEIDACIVQAKERSYETMLSFGKRGLNMAASAAVQAATKVLRVRCSRCQAHSRYLRGRPVLNLEPP